MQHSGIVAAVSASALRHVVGNTVFRCLSFYTRVPRENQDEFPNQHLTDDSDSVDRQKGHVTPRKRVAVGSGSGPHTDVDRLMRIQVRRTCSSPRQWQSSCTHKLPVMTLMQILDETMSETQQRGMTLTALHLREAAAT